VKQLVLVSLIALALLGLLALPAGSQTPDTDSLDVSVSPLVVLGVNITETQFDYGELALSPSDQIRTIATSPNLTVTNTGNATVDLLIQGSHATSSTGDTTWTLNCTPDGVMGTVGLNQYVHRFYTVLGGGGTAQALCPDTDKTLQAGVASNGFFEFKLQMNMPTGTTGFSQRNSTVTITAVEN
jgi:hypothetical protein